MDDAGAGARVVVVGRRRWVPDNRWDLVVSEVDERMRSPNASVAVVIPYFEQPDSLERMYAALSRARLDPRRHEVIVVDDGSARPPPPPPSHVDLTVRHLRQPDLGCRPGAARNLGARSTAADILVFLDADTMPCPSTIQRLAAWPDVLPDALVVGRRHHADLADWSPTDVAAWFDGTRPAPPRRTDPAWLEHGYLETRNLLDADDRSYRYIISGVMSCSRALFDDIGGFDGERAEYGGEDWELAFRAFNNGAVLVHDRSAIVWHDEPDRAERDGRAIDQTAETLWLATRIPEPTARPPVVAYEVADTVAVLDLADVAAGPLVATITSTIDAFEDVAIHVVSNVPPAVEEHFRFDRRIRFAAPASTHVQRCRALVVIRRPLRDVAVGLQKLVTAVRPGGVGTVRVISGAEEIITVSATRAIGRLRRAQMMGAPIGALATLLGEQRLDADGIGLAPTTQPVDLRAEFGGW